MTDLIVALGLALAIEGTIYALLPGGMKSMMRQMLDASDQTLRLAGVALLGIGVVIVWLVRG